MDVYNAEKTVQQPLQHKVFHNIGHRRRQNSSAELKRTREDDLKGHLEAINLGFDGLGWCFLHQLKKKVKGSVHPSKHGIGNWSLRWPCHSLHWFWECNTW